MKFPKSKFGLTLSIIFFLISVVLAIYSETCGDDICGYVVLIPTFPWWMLSFFIHGSSVAYVLFLLSIVINSIIVYWIGKGVEKLFSKIF